MNTFGRALAGVGAGWGILLAAAALAVSGCAQDEAVVPIADTVEVWEDQARGIASNLSLEAACGQLIMTGIGGRGVLDPATLALLSDLPAGAVILFGFNVPPRAADLKPILEVYQEAARASGAGIPLFVAIDHEGGVVFRFREGVTRLPSAKALGEAGLKAVKEAGSTAGRELKNLGISLNLAP
ncbi:MAG TPA: glycoside hydrolase family 3 N-terminal domain-containing protein, partial [Magnetospirillaceae bacterium]|nr:glycoside hydrolase family 3 N-terminal domain-containing protein [Magnetospirillaceae bacterium]